MFSIQGLEGTYGFGTTSALEPVQVFVKVDLKADNLLAEPTNPAEKIKEEDVELGGNVHRTALSRRQEIVLAEA